MIDPATPRPVDHAATSAAILELVRTPLTAIRAAAEILRDHVDLSQAERREFAQAMLIETERLDAIIALLFASQRYHPDACAPCCSES